jgi:hypothetical protein
MRSSAWALSLCFAAVTVLSWMYFFTTDCLFRCNHRVLNCSYVALSKGRGKLQ